MREDGGCSWMLNPGNKTGNGGEITEEESLRVDCFASSWAFHQVVGQVFVRDRGANSPHSRRGMHFAAMHCRLLHIFEKIQLLCSFFTTGRLFVFISAQRCTTTQQRSSLCNESVRVLVFSSTRSCSNIEHAYFILVKRPFNGR